MNMRRAKPTLRIQFLGLCMLVGLSGLLLRLWWVQVARGADHDEVNFIKDQLAFVKRYW